MNKRLVELLVSLIDGLDHEIENKQIKEILFMSQSERGSLVNRLSQLITDYELVDNKLDIPSAERKNLKREFSELIDQRTQFNYADEEITLLSALQASAVERYMIDTYFNETVFEIDYDIKRISQTDIAKMIDQKVDGKLWSDRLWTNKKELNKQLRKEVYDFMDGKTNINEMSERISKRFKQDFNRSRRLVRNEAKRVQTEADKHWAEENGVEQRMFTATLDYRTSKICEDLDGIVYDIDDKSMPDIPDDTHINCRSTYVNVPYKGWKPTVRYDNWNRRNINYQTYKEWLAANPA